MRESGSKRKLAILGGGALGLAVARILAAGSIPFSLWSRSEATRRKASRALGGGVVVDTVAEAAGGAGAVLLAVPAPALREVCGAYGEVATGDQVVVHACRGVAEGFTLPHEVIRQESCARKIAVLGGPLHAVEMSSGRPLAVAAASRFDEAVQAVSYAMAGSLVRVHPSRDVVGVEVAGAVSNVTALALGLADGLGLGETPRGVLKMRGLTEATSLGLALGADRETFSGLAGVGDLIPRRVAATRRHHEAGALLAKEGASEATSEDLRLLEGAVTARETRAMADRTGLSLPMVSAVAQVLSGEADPAAALESVLGLDLHLGVGS
ncbi:MAG: NAD(P)-binding domain-containing protein [Myxococcota bacterium]